MKRSIIIALVSFVLIGCNKDEVTLEKDDYLVFKQELIEQEKFTKNEELKFDLEISVDRINEEEVSYRAIIDNPKENMNNVKALIIHNYFTDDIFPSIGIFDEPINLIVDEEEVKGINLVGYIKTTKDISDLNLEVKVYIEYTNDSGELVEVYYKTTN